jgi:hypothetical protein
MNYFEAKNAVKFGGQVARAAWQQPCYIQSNMASPPTTYLTDGLAGGINIVYEPSAEDIAGEDWGTLSQIQASASAAGQ